MDLIRIDHEAKTEEGGSLIKVMNAMDIPANSLRISLKPVRLEISLVQTENEAVHPMSLSE